MSDQPQRPSLRLTTVNLDCQDAQAMAAFYGSLLGWDAIEDCGDFVILRNPDGGVGLSFQAEAWYRPPVWPEQPGELTKMLHLDIKAEDLEAAVTHGVTAGARLAEHQPREDLRVLLDPAGHPFCLYLV